MQEKEERTLLVCPLASSLILKTVPWEGRTRSVETSRKGIWGHWSVLAAALSFYFGAKEVLD